MTKMRLATDLDGVLADTVPQLVLWHNNTYGTTLKEEDVNTCDMWKLWGGTREETLEKFDEFFHSDYPTKIKPVEGAKEGIEKLQQHFDIYVVTARPTIAAEKTERWLTEHFGKFKGVRFADDMNYTKSCICSDLEAHALIEDLPSNALECALDRTVLLYDSPWNKECVGKNIERVSSWKDIVSKLMT